MISVQSLFPLPSNNVLAPLMLAYSSLKYLSTTVIPSVTISLIYTLSLVMDSFILTDLLTESWMRIPRQCLLTIKKSSIQSKEEFHPNKGVSWESIMSLNAHWFQLTLRQFFKFLNMLCFICIQKRLSAVLCMTAQFGVKSSSEGELFLQYSVSTFHYHAVFLSIAHDE